MIILAFHVSFHLPLSWLLNAALWVYEMGNIVLISTKCFDAMITDCRSMGHGPFSNGMAFVCSIFISLGYVLTIASTIM